MYTKTEIFNLALSALLLNKEVNGDVETDPSKEVKVLRVNYKAALATTLAEMDLDHTSVQKNLELIEADPNDLWLYAYKYPSKCALFRRIQSSQLKDNADTQIEKVIRNHNGAKAIFTNETAAIGEFISVDTPLTLLSPSAGLAVAYKLALMAAPLIAGKMALAIKKDLQQSYLLAKEEARKADVLENYIFDTPDDQSDFVRERTS